MIRYLKSPASLTLLLLVGAVGCQNKDNTIAQVDPYVGHRPEPPAQLPPPRQHVEAPPSITPAPSGGERGWTPRGGFSSRWEYIVVHHSDSDKSTPQGMRSWHLQRGWDDLGYHFVIGNGIGWPDGEVFVGGRWNNQKHGAHCKTPNNFYNDHGIGICLIGDLDQHPPTRKQMQSLARLTNFLSQHCNISRSHITTHGRVTHKTACPGHYFSLNALITKMAGNQQALAASSE